MDKFTKLTGIAAALPIRNIDTDMIIPKQFLKTIKRTGLGKSLFFEMRYDTDGKENAEFVLNKPAYRSSTILVTGDNFGCGSSREHAPWAIADHGIRALLAPSYADIFFSNCCKNGVLAVTLAAGVIDGLFAAVVAHPGYRLEIDLEAQQVKTPEGEVHVFEFNPALKSRLLAGLDDIGVTLQQADAIRAYEARRAATMPWL